MTETATNDGLGDLPCWDLSDLYAGREAEALSADLDEAERAAEDLAGRYRGRLAEIDGAGLAALLDAYEALADTLGRITVKQHPMIPGDPTDLTQGIECPDFIVSRHQGNQHRVFAY